MGLQGVACGSLAGPFQMSHTCGEKISCELSTASVTSQAPPTLPQAYILQGTLGGEMAGNGCFLSV